MSFIVYVLADPHDRTRYVGITKRKLTRRYSEHLRIARLGGSAPVNRWVDGLLSIGQQPIIKLIARSSVRNGREAERIWIGRLVRRGCQLLNVSGQYEVMVKRRR